MARKGNPNHSALGYVLIFLGVIFLLIKVGVISELLFLYFLGGGFLLVYFILGGTKQYGNIGFLIPGVIVLAISLFTDLQTLPAINWIGGGLFFIFLAAAFLVVYLHTNSFHAEDWGARNWPLFPVIGLVSMALFIFIAEQKIYIIGQIRLINILLPVFLIGLGIYLIGNSRNHKEMGDSEEDG